jgi:hypothetical protein
MLLVSVMLLCAAPLVGRNRTFSDAIFLSIRCGVNPCRRKRVFGVSMQRVDARGYIFRGAGTGD